MKSAGLLFNVAILLALSGCGTTRDDFKELCSQSAKIQITDKTTWSEYVRELQAYYRRFGLDSRNIRIEAVDGFDLRSSLQDLKPSEVPRNTPVRTTLTISRHGTSFAVVHSYFISFSGFDGPSPFECAREFPEFYEDFRKEAVAS